MLTFEIKAGFVLKMIKLLKRVNIKQTLEILFNEKTSKMSIF